MGLIGVAGYFSLEMELAALRHPFLAVKISPYPLTSDSTDISHLKTFQYPIPTELGFYLS